MKAKLLGLAIARALLAPVYGFYNRHLCLYTAFYSAEVTNLNATPPVRVKVNKLQSRIRYALGIYTAPAVNPQIADTIAFVRLPKGCRVIGHLAQLNWSAGTAACTLNLGDAASAARHLAATAITAAATATPQAASANGASFETTDESLSSGDPTATNNCDLRGTVAGAVVAVAQVIALHMAFSQD